MKIRDIMTTEVRTAPLNQNIFEIAKLMADEDIGSVFINDGDRLVGVVTDRDIAVRAVACKKSESTPAREIMSETVRYCFDDEDVGHVSENMADIQLRRLPVMDRNKRLVGVVSLGNMTLAKNRKVSSTLMSGVAQPH